MELLGQIAARKQATPAQIALAWLFAQEAVLVTSNRRDFERVPGLRIEDWTVA